MKKSIIIAFCSILVMNILPLSGAESGIELHSLEKQLLELKEQEQLLQSALTIIGERLPRGSHKELDEARDELDKAEEAKRTLFAAAGLPEIEIRLQAALDERNKVIIEFLTDSPEWQHINSRLPAVEEEIALLEAADELAQNELINLSKLRDERARLQKASDLVLGTHSLWRHVDAVEPLNAAAWDIILQEQRPARKQIEGLKELEQQIKNSTKKLRTLLPEAATASTSGRLLNEELTEITEEIRALEAAQDELYKNVLHDGPLWHHEIEVEQGPDNRGRERKPGKVSLWLPPATPYIRGIIICDHIVIGSRLAKDKRIRYTAAQNGLAVILQFDSTFSAADAPRQLETYLTQLAEIAGHPELDRIPLLTIGHSTGGIFARNVAYWKPERVMGIIHIKSGNLHQHIRPEHNSLAGIPFTAINGEFEDCGPEGGGKRGIRNEYKDQTQWVMLREQILRRRKADEANLMNLVVDPGGSHTGWNSALTRYCARFIHKAAKHRLPEPPGNPEMTVNCRAVDVKDGWLSDADIKAPRHKAAPYHLYQGNKQEAFWHFDEELAQTVARIHSEMKVPDSSRRFPVSADWP